MGVAIVGAGPWGVSLATAAARAGSPTLIYSRRALGSALPKGVEQARDLKTVGAQARIVVLTVPTPVVRTVARELGDHLDGRHYVIHGVRGLVGDAMETVSDVVRTETPARRVGALGGPVLAEELSAGKPSVMVCSSPFPEVNSAVQEAFGDANLRVYPSEDLRGLEWASALVGCLAIGVGFAQEVGLGAGPLAAVITRAVHEAARIAEAAGGEQRTMLGLGGYGDLLACIAQKGRPEVVLGAALARRRSVEQAVAEAKLRVEAVDLIPRIVTWAEKNGARAPIMTALSAGLFRGGAPDEIIRTLMTAPRGDGG